MTTPIDPQTIGNVAGIISSLTGGAKNAANSAASDASNALKGVVPGASQLGDITDEARAVRAWITNRHNWTRVAWFLGGSVMFTVGAVMVGERPVANATNAVVAPVGRIVKSAH